MKIIRPFAVTDASLTSSVAEDASSAWNDGVSYAVGQVVHLVSSHRRYESLVGSNLNNNPATDSGTNWLNLGPTNRWAMFDQLNGTATEATDELSVTIVTTGRIDSVALLEIDATTATITASYDAVELYSETFNLADYSGMTDWYEYFFAEVDYQTDLVITDLPIYAGMTITITISGGSTVSLGNCVIGQSRVLGGTVYGARVGIIDYSRKTVDDFGNITIVERAYSKRGSFDVVVSGESSDDAASKVDAIQKLLTTYRATPLVFVGSDTFSSTSIFGFYKSFDLNIAFPTQHRLTLEIEGLT